MLKFCETDRKHLRIVATKNISIKW